MEALIVTVVENGFNDSSLNPRRGFLHSDNTLGNGLDRIILPPAMGK